MTPSYWYSPVAAFLWQVVLHSAVAGFVFYAWQRHLRLTSGRVRRWMLSAVLVVPLATALVPGRAGFEFREQTAWLDSTRLLAIPFYDGMHFYHLALAVAVFCIVVSVWQEIVPFFRRLKADFNGAPENLVRRVRTLPHWAHCRVGVLPEEGIFLATNGWPSRPRLIVSTGALRQLDEEELDAVLRHEHAHWSRGRWHVAHLLFCLRAMQLHNPVAHWVFREYSIETEIDCDAEAVSGRSPKHLARALLKVYESTDRRDVSARSGLRKRVDILLGRSKLADDDIPISSILLASMTLALCLPWVV